VTDISLPAVLAVAGTSPATMVVFVVYILGVFLLAALSHRVLARSSFLGEYFLGSRTLGTWTLAFTFAATSASGGSFGGFPSLIYSHGWVLALWIGSYMVFPLTAMGLLGKRLNQVARKSGAITIPDVFRDRFESTAAGLLASCAIILFTMCFLVAQFKLGALIIEDTFNISFRFSYEISLMVFAAIVVFYTAYGGFRAVVWTDVMQGVVMGVGVVLLIPIVVSRSGGLDKTTHSVHQQLPTAVTSVRGPGGEKGTFNDLAFRSLREPHPTAVLYVHPGSANAPLTIGERSAAGGTAETVEVSLATGARGEVVSTANDVKRAVEAHSVWGPALEVVIPYRNDKIVTEHGTKVHKGATGVIWFPEERRQYNFAFIRGEEFVFGPGRKNDGKPFHPLGMIVSFFFFFAIVAVGQPSCMLRLMAFKDSRTLKRSMLTVTVVYALIYMPLVFVVMAARPELPLLTPEDADRSIVLIATRLVADMGLGFQILGAIFIAAPFAAVMSTVDSLLLMISSGVVRDIYQRTINPHVSDQTVKRASYTTTVVVGLLVAILASRPPDFLQSIIVFVAGGFGSTFVAAMLLGLFWKRTTRQGALAAMVGGLVINLGLCLPTLLGGSRLDVIGLEPTLWGVSGSFVLGTVVSWLTGPPPSHLVERYFYEK
jgi:sodium/pantothenate symporter